MQRLLWPVAVLSGLAIIYLGKPILVPLLFAILLAQVLAPVVKRLEKYVPSAVAALIAVLTIFAALAGIVVLLSSQLSMLQAALPKLQERAIAIFADVQHFLGYQLGVNRAEQQNMVHKSIETSLSGGGAIAFSALLFSISTLLEAALIGVLAYLMLYYRRHFRHQLRVLVERHGTDSMGTLVERTAELGQSYVAGLGVVMAVVGSLDAIGFLLIGAPFPALFGMLGASALLIPYIGIIVIGPICALVAYASAGAAVAGGVLLVFAIVHFLEGNVISPYVVGSKVNLNPLATILAVLIGGELWGPAGMALFIPLVGILKLVLDGTEVAQPYARLLGTISAEDLRPRRPSPFIGKIIGRVRARVPVRARNQSSGSTP